MGPFVLNYQMHILLIQRSAYISLPRNQIPKALDFTKTTRKQLDPQFDSIIRQQISDMPTTKKPHHCPVVKAHGLPGNCIPIKGGMCKTHHVFCKVKGHGTVFFLYVERCPVCTRKYKADDRKALQEMRDQQTKKANETAAAIRQASNTKGRNPMRR